MLALVAVGMNLRTKVISLRLPGPIVTALVVSAKHADLSVSALVALLIRNSFTGTEIIRTLVDSPAVRTAKLDLRMAEDLAQSLNAVALHLQVSPSVYIRKLLYNFYITKRVRYLSSNGRYTLAHRND